MADFQHCLPYGNKLLIFKIYYCVHCTHLCVTISTWNIFVGQPYWKYIVVRRIPYYFWGDLPKSPEVFRVTKTVCLLQLILYCPTILSYCFLMYLKIFFFSGIIAIIVNKSSVFWLSCRDCVPMGYIAYLPCSALLLLTCLAFYLYLLFLTSIFQLYLWFLIILSYKQCHLCMIFSNYFSII